MENFSTENRLSNISQMTEQITADKRLAWADFELVKKIAEEYEILKREMRQNSQTKMLVLSASVTKFLQQELSDLEASGTALSTEHNRALKKLERALDFNQDFQKEYNRKNTRIGDGAFKNFFKNADRRETDSQKVNALETQNNHIDSFVFNPNDLKKTAQENIDIGLKNIGEKILKITQDGNLGGVEDFKEIREMTKFFNDAKKSENPENMQKIFHSEETLYLRAMMLQIWKNKAHYTDEHFRYLWQFEESLYQNTSEMPEANRRNHIISALFSSDARDRRDEKAAAYEKELSHNRVFPFVSVKKNFPQNAPKNSESQEKIPTNNTSEKIFENTKNTVEKNSENSGTLHFLDKELPSENQKIAFAQIGLNYFYENNALKITGNRDEATEAALKKFQEDFDKKFPNAYKNPNENPFNRTIHNLWYELSQKGFDTIKIIDEAIKKIPFKQENSQHSSQNNETQEKVSENNTSEKNFEKIPEGQEIRYLQFAMDELRDVFPELKDRIMIVNGVSDKNFINNLKILQKNLKITTNGEIDASLIERTQKTLGERKHSIVLMFMKDFNAPKEEKPENTWTLQNTEKSKISPSNQQITEWSKKPHEIPNETLKIFYVQRALNLIKHNITEPLAKKLIHNQVDLEINGKLDSRTEEAIKAFQVYINHYKYHKPNEPINTDGKLTAKTFEAMVSRINMTGNSQSENLLRNAINDINQ